MTEVMVKALSLVLVILLAYTFKRVGILKAESRETVTKIVLNITLPAAIITSFAGYQPDPALGVMVLLGFACNVFFLLWGLLVTLGKSREERVFGALNYPGFNIGSFTLPFVQSFLGASGVVTTCMFDVGNSIMCTGGTYAITSTVFGSRDEKMSMKGFVKKLFSTVPFDTYVIMLLFSLTGVVIPEGIVKLLSPAASANGFLAMMMLGLMFEVQWKKRYFKAAIKILGQRYLIMALFAVLAWWFLPLPQSVLKVLVLLLFSPMSALCPVFTEKCGADQGLSGFLTSVSILISVAVITVLMPILGVS